MYYKVYYQQLPERKFIVETVSSKEAKGTLNSVYTYSHNVGQSDYSSGICATRISADAAIVALRSHLLKEINEIKNNLVKLDQNLNDFDEAVDSRKKY